MAPFTKVPFWYINLSTPTCQTLANPRQGMSRQEAALCWSAMVRRTGGEACCGQSRGTFSILFQGSFFSENHQQPWGNSRFLKRTMVEKNGESTPRVKRVSSCSRQPKTEEASIHWFARGRWLSQQVSRCVAALPSLREEGHAKSGQRQRVSALVRTLFWSIDRPPLHGDLGLRNGHLFVSGSP